MELNRRTKLTGGVLALAVAALIYDRVISGGPVSADAAPLQPAAAAADPSPASPARNEASPSQGALARRLDALDDVFTGPMQREDAFAAPITWFPKESDAATAAPAPVAKRAGEHSVRSVLIDKGQVRSAIVDGRLLRPGVPVKVNDGAKTRTYELVRAWIHEGKSHAEVRINGELLELSDESKAPQ